MVFQQSCGHINPLYAQDQGVLHRAGHTEAGVDMARLAGLYPAAALMEIMSDDGTMARLPELRRLADEWDMKLISIRDLIAYRLKQESLVEKGEEVDMPTEYGHFRLIPFRQKSKPGKGSPVSAPAGKTCSSRCPEHLSG